MPSDEFLQKQHARFVVPKEAKSARKIQDAFVQELKKKPTEIERRISQSTNLTMLRNQSNAAFDATQGSQSAVEIGSTDL